MREMEFKMEREGLVEEGQDMWRCPKGNFRQVIIIHLSLQLPCQQIISSVND